MVILWLQEASLFVRVMHTEPVVGRLPIKDLIIVSAFVDKMVLRSSSALLLQYNNNYRQCT